MNFSGEVKQKLKRYGEKTILITRHAREQATIRSISFEEIKENLLKPHHLLFAGKQVSKNSNEEKYDCCFAYDDTYAHRYVIVLTHYCFVCTVMRITANWREVVKKYERM